MKFKRLFVVALRMEKFWSTVKIGAQNIASFVLLGSCVG